MECWAPTSWIRQIWNWDESHVSLSKLNLSRDPWSWNNNAVPSHMFPKIKEVLQGNVESRNAEDQYSQRTVYYHLFVACKSFATDQVLRVFIEPHASTSRALVYLRHMLEPCNIRKGRRATWETINPLHAPTMPIHRVENIEEEEVDYGMGFQLIIWRISRTADAGFDGTQ